MALEEKSGTVAVNNSEQLQPEKPQVNQVEKASAEERKLQILEWVLMSGKKPLFSHLIKRNPICPEDKSLFLVRYVESNRYLDHH
ncbi:hypothetical protein CDAR_69321 [Caerostris darwini]|uniref:Uncharacterized protein n=1 Tax=Caerostris darwini TaxID=1538125 RepID=A0AAV4U0L2_9ARAC|nr:hypothetical protein CDAR_69321 [Caerostris darwini]